MLQKKLPYIIAAIFAMLAVALGAFGAHGLKTMVTVERLATWQTAVEYQFFHALAILILGLYRDRSHTAWLQWSTWCLIVGVLIFSGSLYILVLADMPRLGMITPIGGVLMIVGWLLFVMHLLKQPDQTNDSH
jgi:uncharacterized membrane protein YgdD (TMEM256/DUF423 family)